MTSEHEKKIIAGQIREIVEAARMRGVAPGDIANGLVSYGLLLFKIAGVSPSRLAVHLAQGIRVAFDEENSEAGR